MSKKCLRLCWGGLTVDGSRLLLGVGLFGISGYPGADGKRSPAIVGQVRAWLLEHGEGSITS